MRDKNKFVAFILAAIPGLAHLYAGFKERAIIFFMIFTGIVVGSMGLYIAGFDGEFAFLIVVLAYPVIWLVALIDMFSTWKKVELRQLYNNGESGLNIEEDSKMNKKTITMALSIIPGAGHMYLGYQKKGLLIMGAFMFSIFFMGWLRISFLLFLLPLIWFYSFLDALHTVEGTKENVRDDELELPKIKPEFVGYGLIAMGLIIIIERILYPLISYEIRSYIQTSIVSLIFIAGGIGIINKNKKSIETSDIELIEVEGEEDHED